MGLRSPRLPMSGKNSPPNPPIDRNPRIINAGKSAIKTEKFVRVIINNERRCRAAEEMLSRICFRSSSLF